MGDTDFRRKKKTKRSFIQQAHRARRNADRDGEQSVAFKGTNIDKVRLNSNKLYV